MKDSKKRGKDELWVEYIDLNNKCCAYQVHLSGVEGRLDKVKLEQMKIPKK